MYITSKKSKSVTPVIVVNDATFARVVAVNDDGSLDIEFVFNISQTYVVKNDALTVNVTVRNDKVNAQLQVKSLNSATLGKQLITAMVSAGQTSKSAAVTGNNVIEFKRVDVLSKINKDELMRLKILNERAQAIDVNSSHALTTFTTSYESVIDLKQRCVTVPVLCRYVMNNDVQDEFLIDESSLATSLYTQKSISPDIVKSMSSMSKREMRYRALTSDGVSPSSIDANCTPVIPTSDAVNGFYGFRASKHASVKKLIEAMTMPIVQVEKTSSDLADDELVAVPNVRFIDSLRYGVVLTIPNPLEKTLMAGGIVSNVFVTFELVNSRSNVVLESVTKNVDVVALTKAYSTPMMPLDISMGVIKGTCSHIDVNASDVMTTSMNVYKKTLSRVTPFNIESSFESFGDKRELLNGSLRLNVPNPCSGINVYRVVPVGPTKVAGATFSDVVVRSDQRFYNKFVSIVAYPSKNGMTVELRGFSYDVVSVQVVRRDMTLCETVFSAVGDPALLTPQNRSNAALYVYDDGVKDGHVYEYSTKLYMKAGFTQTFGSSIVEYISYVEGVDTRITDVSITSGQRPDVSFTLSTTIAASGLDDIVAMMDAQNLKQYFNDDILKERDKLQQLIAHNVVRVNVTEGVREDFGVVTDAYFVDSRQRKNNSVSVIDTRNAYRYEVTALLRTPESSLEEFVKQARDNFSGRVYEFKPSKFLHPVTLKRGNITTPESLRVLHGKKPMMFGRVGNLEMVDVSFTQTSMTISRANAVLRDASNVFISWNVSGDINLIDHFIVMSVSNDVRRIVGTAHPYTNTNECRFVHRITSVDRGYVCYAIVPVMHDYVQLAEVVTNKLMV